MEVPSLGSTNQEEQYDVRHLRALPESGCPGTLRLIDIVNDRRMTRDGFVRFVRTTYRCDECNDWVKAEGRIVDPPEGKEPTIELTYELDEPGSRRGQGGGSTNAV